VNIFAGKQKNENLVIKIFFGPVFEMKIIKLTTSRHVEQALPRFVTCNNFMLSIQMLASWPHGFL
jgi:hypothetical protein